jgi:hypothetical protein
MRLLVTPLTPLTAESYLQEHPSAQKNVDV